MYVLALAIVALGIAYIGARRDGASAEESERAKGRVAVIAERARAVLVRNRSDLLTDLHGLALSSLREFQGGVTAPAARVEMVNAAGQLVADTRSWTPPREAADRPALRQALGAVAGSQTTLERPRGVIRQTSRPIRVEGSVVAAVRLTEGPGYSRREASRTRRRVDALSRRAERKVVSSEGKLRLQLAALASAAVDDATSGTELGRIEIVDSRRTLLARSGRPVAEPEPSPIAGDDLTEAMTTSRPIQRYVKADAESVRRTTASIISGRSVVGAVRLTETDEMIAARIDAAGGWLQRDVMLIIGAVLLMGLVVVVVLARAIAAPMRSLEEVVRRVSTGDLAARAPAVGSREQRVLAHAFNDMASQLERLLGSQQAFVANASHELRTPLSGLRLRLELLRRRVHQHPQAVNDAEHALAEVDRLSGIVDELLVLSQAGERTAESAPIELRDVARAAAERWRPAAQSGGIALVDESCEAGCAVKCAVADLDRILDVLIENALQYSPAGSSVTIRTSEDGVQVLDHGPGLAAGEDELVFERFRRGRAGRSGPPGSGLGLAIARELAQACGGRVAIANRPEGGATASLDFSALREPVEAQSDFTLA